MLTRKKCIAMLLAGGQGSRLYALTNKIAKPAVSFGGKYRIIDFPLSNCVNSGIDTIGVLTQYQPLILNEYIGNGQPWDLDRTMVVRIYFRHIRLKKVVSGIRERQTLFIKTCTLLKCTILNTF